jgi:hypothetical protein
MKMNHKTLAVLSVFLLSLTFTACEENDLLPDYEYVGTSTATLASIGVSNDEPAPGETIEVTMTYANTVEDPASQLRVLASVDGGDFTEVTTFDESSAPTNEEISRTFSYTVPNVDDGTEIDLDMVLSTQREFPQRERTSIEVTEE